MLNKNVFTRAALLTVSLLLTACGGGGGNGDGGGSDGSAPGDTIPGSPAQALARGLDRFLVFPNPQVLNNGTFQTTTIGYAQAYYRAVDPLNERDTLAKFQAKNGFGNAATGTEFTIVFGDRRDLGYGRLMTARRNNDGTLAFFVENYLVQAGGAYGYTTINLDAAVVRDTRHHIGTNAIEFSPGPAGGANFLKFYTYEEGTGNLRLEVDLDGRGEKAMPGPCISCHGGRGDPLTPPDATGLPRFPLVANTASGVRGDVQARLHPIEADAVDFSSLPGFTRAEQEALIKTFNKFVLCSYPISAADQANGFPEDACRPLLSGGYEWAGGGADLIKAAYGGDTLPSPTFSDTFVPTGWLSAGQSTLYQEVYATSCRACHSLRGVGVQSDIDFDSFAKFQSYATPGTDDRIKAHVYDRGNMPLAGIVYDAFYESPTRPVLLADFLTDQGFTMRDSSGALLVPGRPIADPGPDRVVRQGDTNLSALGGVVPGGGSLNATSYRWRLVSGPAGGATLSNTTGASTRFNATIDGTYVVELVASVGRVSSDPANVTLEVDSAPPVEPQAGTAIAGLTLAGDDVRFADVRDVLQDGTAGCTNAGCHLAGGEAPIIYQDIDRDDSGGAPDATDLLWFYTEVRGRVNFTDLAASPLLRKPSNNHHGGNLRTGFDTTLPVGDPGRMYYDLFVTWMLNGAPQ